MFGMSSDFPTNQADNGTCPKRASDGRIAELHALFPYVPEQRTSAAPFQATMRKSAQKVLLQLLRRAVHVAEQPQQTHPAKARSEGPQVLL